MIREEENEKSTEVVFGIVGFLLILIYVFWFFDFGFFFFLMF